VNHLGAVRRCGSGKARTTFGRRKGTGGSRQKSGRKPDFGPMRVEEVGSEGLARKKKAEGIRRL